VTLPKGWPDGVRLICFDELDSTNEEARRLAAAGDTGPVWIAARKQSKGRGRRGNSWISEPGNLFATLLLTAPHAIAAQLGFAASLATADVVASYTAPARVRRLSGARFELVLHEGRNRQVRRMVEAVGHRVRHLHRSVYAGLTLDGLAPGEWRELTASEVERLRRSVPPPA